MACSPDVLSEIKLFSLLDDEERAILASQVELKTFVPRQRIYRMGDGGGKGYVLLSGTVEVTTVDEDGQEFVLDSPIEGEFFGFASMVDMSPHQTNAYAMTNVACIEFETKDLMFLLERKPMAGMDILSVLARQYHTTHHVARLRARRNPNEMIDEAASLGDRLADYVAKFAGSWTFIIAFLLVLGGYSWLNVYLGQKAWDPYPFILLNLFLSMLAAVQAPIIMMSQNRQDAKDRLRSELDFDVNKRAATDIQGLAKKLHQLHEKVCDIEDHIRHPGPSGN